VKWDSTSYTKADPSLKSFVFTLKNPHNFPARKFALRAEKKDEAIICSASAGPSFLDISVGFDSSTVFFGSSYANDTGRPGSTFFTGSYEYSSKEIEVFEITD
jgi:hypothetical protein